MNHFASTSICLLQSQRGCDRYRSDRKEGSIKFFNHAGCPCSNPLVIVREKQPSPPDLGVAENPSALTHSPLTCSHSFAPSTSETLSKCIQYKINQLRSKHQQKCKLSYLTLQGLREGKISPYPTMSTPAVIFCSSAAIYITYKENTAMSMESDWLAKGHDFLPRFVLRLSQFSVLLLKVSICRRRCKKSYSIQPG